MLVPVQETELSDIADGNVKWYNHFEIICLFLKRLSTHLPLNPIISLLGVHLREKKAYVHVKADSQMFIAALLVTAKSWKQPKHSSTGEQITSCGIFIAME